jgi:glycosyltransferase involved in cell wall biosynthesis
MRASLAPSMSSEIRLSVALVTRDRPDQLDNCLASLRAQSIQPFEVIVSDDSSADYMEATRAVAGRHRCIYVTGPRRGLYANRNFAAKKCSGSHIRTMDDDHILPPGHLARCVAAVEGDPHAIWTTGEIGYLENRPVDIAEVANQLAPSGVGEQITNQDSNWGISDGSTIYPRQIFDLGFRMVEDFGFGSTYLEFGAYLYRHGWKSRCVPGAKVEHHATVRRPGDPLSIMFASLCYNLYFRPNAARLARFLVPRWQRWSALPHLLKMARNRWSAVVDGAVRH